jgi:hypothetical protein
MARPNFDEIAKITRDLNYAYIAGYKRLIGRDDILALKGGGDLKLYETVAQDDQVKSCVQQRISAVISRDWGVEPGDDSKPAQQAAEFIMGVDLPTGFTGRHSSSVLTCAGG